MNKPCVYKITNIVNSKFYIGSTINLSKRIREHFHNLRNGTHINNYLQNAFNKYGEGSFEFEVVAFCETEEETRLLEEDLILKTYNTSYNLSKCATGGDNISYHPNRDGIAYRISQGLYKRYENMSPEERQRWSDVRKGKGNGMFGRTHSKDARLKISKARIKAYQIDPTSNPFYGRKHTDETRKKLSEYASKRTGSKNSFYGRNHSEETRAKIGAVHRGKKNESQARKVVIDDTIYESVSSAGRVLGVTPNTIINRIRNTKNKKFENYRYL